LFGFQKRSLYVVQVGERKLVGREQDYGGEQRNKQLTVSKSRIVDAFHALRNNKVVEDGHMSEDLRLFVAFLAEAARFGVLRGAFARVIAKYTSFDLGKLGAILKDWGKVSKIIAGPGKKVGIGDPNVEFGGDGKDWTEYFNGETCQLKKTCQLK
jgi:hypothetical protein